ncbi:MAG: gliding motility-associated ABC transporter substrate-binding protein GldG [Thermonema sp.]|uniref:gliding motility-associated ABC transporter substrate-binding protein GldG n=1 Tax=Thermonema sp. TaxID=2231181 RepID=UPI0021DD3AF9|nr:gliding motility-associated ABC transporter substrate-binding protein GldG [Thermonema sp.]GIV39068.1 MAG: gliding motility-associated ABC transporter substrate-binding protein GldG [Thermonema sp.]
MKRSQKRMHALRGFLIGVAAIIALNLLAQYFVIRIDLTEDKRYSIAPQTQELLRGLEGPVFIQVYLHGDDLPADFRRLRRSMEELLEEFRVYGGSNIQYRFIDPQSIEPAEARDSLIQYLAMHGVSPTNVFVKEEGKRVEKLLFPGAILSYGNKYTSISLLQGDQRAALANPQEIINHSIENMEYELASAIYQLTLKKKKKIAYVYGHKELTPPEVDDLNQSLSRFFQIYGIRLSEVSLDTLDALIIAKPQTAFSEEEKYKIDQYVMKGGNVLFFLDAVEVREDSINTPEGAVSIGYDHRLIDLLFRYGIRYNYELIEDLNCGVLGLIIGEMAGKPQMEFLPWRYYPIFYNFFPHPVTKNLNAVFGRYVCTLDTVKADGVKKIPLIASSPKTKVLDIPFVIHYNEARLDPDPELFNDGARTVAYLLEGRFRSLYQNRILPSDPRAQTFLAESVKPTRIFICADGDFIRNEVNWQKKQVLPLGYDRNTGITFDNKRFVVNLLHYMLDDNQLILARNKEVRLRYLDKDRVQQERTFWQAFNLYMPLLITLMLGGVYHLVRYWRFGRLTK